MVKSKEAAAPITHVTGKTVESRSQDGGPQEADFGAMFDDDDDEEEEVVEPAKQSKKAPMPSPATRAPVEPQESSKAFEQSVVNGLFGDDDDDEEENGAQPLPLPSVPKEKPPVATKKPIKAKPPTPLQQEPLPEAPVSTEPFSVVEEVTPPPPPNKNLPGVPKNWTGKTPKKQLEEYLQKQKLGRPIFQKGQDNSCILILKMADGDKRFGSVGEFLGHGDAQHAAATRALYALLPNMPLYRLLPHIQIL